MEFESTDTALSILAVYVLIAGLERVPRLRLRPARFWRPRFLTDMGWYMAAVGITLTAGPWLEGIARGRAELGLPGLETFGMPWVLVVLVATVLYDLGATVTHRILHRFDALWRLHKVHHSSRLLDWLATTRAHVLEHLVRGIPTQAFLYVLGVPASAVAAAIAIYATFAALGHSNLRLDLAWIEWLFVTPRIHHAHHRPETTHRNFGTVLTVWDRVLGQLVIEAADEREVLGVPGEISTYPQSWLKQLVEPFRRAAGD